MKIGLIQTDVFSRPETNFETAAGIIAGKAADHDLLCLPELFHTNYSDLPRHVLDPNSPALTSLAALTASFPRAAVVGSLALRREGGVGNTVTLFHRGKIFPLYDKTHLFRPMSEDKYFTPGQSLAIVDLRAGTGVWRIGFLICYDLRFPELIRSLASLDCTLIVVVAQWPAVRGHLWEALLDARAAENQLFMAGVNRVGRDGEVLFGGGSRLTGPGGEILARAGDQPEVLSAELDPQLISRSRAFNHCATDIRPDLYRLEWLGMVESLTLP